MSLVNLSYFAYLGCIAFNIKMSYIATFGFWDALWFLLFIVLILCFCIATWFLIENFSSSDTERHEWHFGPSQRDIRLARLNHVEDEVTRYRDLCWKIGALTWGVYYGLNWVVTQEHHPYLWLPQWAFLLFAILAAGFATTFYLYCEYSTIRNKEQRRELQERLSLDARWRFKPGAERVWRFSFLVSATIFLCAIWVPPIAMIFFRK